MNWGSRNKSREKEKKRKRMTAMGKGIRDLGIRIKSGLGDGQGGVDDGRKKEN